MHEDEKVAPKEGIDALIFGEIELLLAEKRTALTSMRTGIAVFALPLTVLSFLVVTSDHYRALRVLPFLIPLLALNAASSCSAPISVLIRVNLRD